MKSFYIASALLAVAGSALARNCTPGLNYCGSTLLAIGKYQPQIDQSLFDNNVSPVDNGKSALFACKGGVNGDIQFLQQCTAGRCSDNGEGNNDSCF